MNDGHEFAEHLAALEVARRQLNSMQVDLRPIRAVLSELRIPLDLTLSPTFEAAATDLFLLAEVLSVLPEYEGPASVNYELVRELFTTLRTDVEFPDEVRAVQASVYRYILRQLEAEEAQKDFDDLGNLKLAAQRMRRIFGDTRAQHVGSAKNISLA